MHPLKSLLFATFILFALISCDNSKKERADLLILDANIYTVDSSFSKAEAMAIKDGKILDIGTKDDIQSHYQGDEITTFGGTTIIPGLFDAHAHFFEFGKSLLKANLVGTESYDEVLDSVAAFQKRENPDFIIGHGWDQNLWPEKEFPTKEKLDKLFPDTPVVLTRIDVHAMLVNQKALDEAKIDENSSAEGGSFIKKNGKLTGVLLDNAMAPIEEIMPEITEKDKTEALLRAQEQYLSYGITDVADAGVKHEDIQLMNKLAKDGQLTINLYPMLIYTDSHVDEYLNDSLGENEAVSSRAIKVFGDGAFGSRGAALREPYSDDPDNYGMLRINPKNFKVFAEKVAESDFQLNTHAIGDSTNHLVLKTYDSILKNDEDRRWRVEHASFVDSKDFKYFSKNIIPSIQSVFAISDMEWIGDRLGKNRVKNAYANKMLLKEAGLVALGTDAPVEEIDPYRTFYAAVTRKNRAGKPQGGFQTDQALSREETLKAMTIWAAYSEFTDDKQGSLEPGKQADFVILDRDIMEVPIDSTINTKVRATYIKGVKVY